MRPVFVVITRLFSRWLWIMGPKPLVAILSSLAYVRIGNTTGFHVNWASKRFASNSEASVQHPRRSKASLTNLLLFPGYIMQEYI